MIYSNRAIDIIYFIYNCVLWSQKLMEELEQQRATLEEMASQIESYKASGKQEAALRLQEQMSLIEQKYAKVQRKFQRFRCPTNIEPRLSRALRELRGIEEATCLLELSSEDPEVIEGQLKHCLVILSYTFIHILHNLRN